MISQLALAPSTLVSKVRDPGGGTWIYGCNRGGMREVIFWAVVSRRGVAKGYSHDIT